MRGKIIFSGLRHNLRSEMPGYLFLRLVVSIPGGYYWLKGYIQGYHPNRSWYRLALLYRRERRKALVKTGALSRERMMARLAHTKALVTGNV